MLRKHFYVRTYKTKVDDGQISISVLNDVQQIEKNIPEIKDYNGKFMTDPMKKPTP
jgi:hypothetical protein